MENRKIALVIRKDLEIWQKLNVAAFLASAVAIEMPETHGQAFVTASARRYLPFVNQPMVIFGAEDLAGLRRAFERAKARDLKIAIFTEPLFATRSEAENLAEIAKLSDDQQNLVGLAVVGESKAVSKALDGLRFLS